MDIITINKNEIIEMGDEGGKLVLKKEAGEYLKKLNIVKAWVDEAMSDAKQQIISIGLNIDKGFKGVQCDGVKAIYRFYGDRYACDETETDKEFLKEVTTTKVDTEAVDRYMSEHGGLPKGIYLRERVKQLAITFKDEQI